jgi:hypothetical protein
MRSPDGAPAARGGGVEKGLGDGAPPCEWGNGGPVKRSEAAVFFDGRAVWWSPVTEEVVL